MLSCRHCHYAAAAAAAASSAALSFEGFPFPKALHLPTRPVIHRPLFFSFPNHKHRKNRPVAPVAVTAAWEATDADDEEEENPGHRRKQNSRSAAVLALLRSQPRRDDSEGDEEITLNEGEEEDGGEEERKKKKLLEEISLVNRRKPRFPGAIDFPKAEDGVPNHILHVGSNSQVLLQALEVRRGVATEILKEALRASRLSINYSTNVVSRMLGFVDRMLIEAVALKGNPEFSHLTFNSRVKSCIQSSGVVPLVKWLKHNSLSYPQIGKVICMYTGDLDRLRHLVEWLKFIHVKGKSLGVVLIRAENLIERSTDELEEVVDYLQSNGVRRDWMGHIVSRCPQVLALSMEDLERRVSFYLDMGMNQNDFGTMVYDYPKVLGFFSLEEMKNKVSYLQEFGLSIDDIGRLLAYKPQLMGCSIEDRWKPLVKYLYYLGVERDGMKRILMMKPMVFCVDLATTIAPKVQFLQDIGVQQDAIGGVLVKFPPILTYSLYKKIRPVVIFLMTKAGVTRKNIGKVIALEPELVGCSIMDKLDVNVKYFLSLGISLQSLGEMVADFPMLLRYNLDVLRPKYRYLRRTMVRPLQDLVEFPRFFSYSLDDRITPRHKILVENRINFKLRYMLAGSDEDFHQRVKAAVEKRHSFESTKVDVNLCFDNEAKDRLPRVDTESKVNTCLSLPAL